MAAASDDLTRPLGVEPPRPGHAPSRLPLGRIAIGLLVAGATCGALYAAMFGDAWGGRPRVVVPVKVAEAAPPPPPVPTPREPASQQGAQRGGSTVEVTAGVAVIRPQSNAPGGGLLIRVPDASTIRLAPAPDDRLIEQSRLGPLPRIGPDGSRAASIYARPVGALPGGVAPAARIAILVGGLGVNPAITEDAIAKLPDAVTLGFAPYGADLAAAAAGARAAGHEIMLQMPMEPLDYPTTDPGPQTLTTAAKPAENLERLRWAMSRFTGFVGVSNFLGGKLTADEAALTPILREIGARGLLFVDDGSSSRSAAGAVADSLRLRAARADLVIDPVSRSELIDRALDRLEATAREKGFALGSASALPLSVERITRWAETLESKGILLVPVSAAPIPGRAR